MSVISFDCVRKSFGDHVVLDGLSFAVERGEIFAIVGASGAGKSVALKHIVGLVAPDSGEVRVDGACRIGYLFQSGALLAWMNVHDNVALPLRETTSLSPDEIDRRVAAALEAVGLSDAAERYPAEISGGVAALTLYHGPFPDVQFIPTGGMNRDNIGSYLRKPFILACGGSWMVKSDLIENENWEEITRLCREAVTALHGFEIAHIGINAENAEEAMNAAKLIAETVAALKSGEIMLLENLRFDKREEKNGADYAKALADELEQQIKDNGDRLSCGFLGTYNLCPTLSSDGTCDCLSYVPRDVLYRPVRDNGGHCHPP